MKLYLLRPRNNLQKRDDPWDPWYDKNFGFVIRAKNEEQARILAGKNSGDETDLAWLDPRYSSCEVLSAQGKTEVISINSRWA